MAWRETRAGWRHVLTVLVCVALGVAALVSVGSLAVELKRTLAREAKTLLGGDVEVRSPRATPRAVVDGRGAPARRGRASSRTRASWSAWRAPAGGASLLVEVKAVDAAYPLYGAVDRRRPAGAWRRCSRDDGAVVEASLLVAARSAVGRPVLARRGHARRARRAQA